MEEKNVLDDKLLKLLFLIKVAKKIEGKTKLQKIVFLGKEEEGLDIGFEFVKYNYGPYSFELTKALDALESLGLIVVETSLFASANKNGFQTKQFTFMITEKGDEVISEKQDKIKEVTEKIKLLVEKWNSVPRNEIVEHVYSKHM